MTLDEARDAFEQDRNAETAHAYLAAAEEYVADGIIEPGTFEAVQRSTERYR